MLEKSLDNVGLSLLIRKTRELDYITSKVPSCNHWHSDTLNQSKLMIICNLNTGHVWWCYHATLLWAGAPQQHECFNNSWAVFFLKGNIIFLFYWCIADLQCCVNFFCTAKWFSYTYIYIHSFFNILFHHGLSQDIEYSSLCYTIGPCCLSILYIIAYIW